MNWNIFKDRINRAAAGDGGSFVLPSLIVEVEPGFVLAARVDRSTGRVQRIETREIQPHSVESFLNQPNLSNPAEFERTVREIAQAVGNGNGRLGLLVPDPIVRVALLCFETLPDSKRDVDALIRWRMKDLLPFPAEEARLSYQVLTRRAEGLELLAMAARSSVLSEYETAVGRLNGGPALVIPATAALLPLLPEDLEAAKLLIHLCPGWVTTVIVSGKRVRTWRTRDLSRVAPEQIAGEVASEAARAGASCRDHHKCEVTETLLCARPPAPRELIAEIARAVSSEVKLLEPRAELAATLPAGDAATFQQFGATLAGVVSNRDNQR